MINASTKKIKQTFLGLFLFALIFSTYAQRKLTDETPLQKKERLAWWVKDRFGMFIHWGIYAMAARHEWVKKHERISDKNYQKYFDNFDPDLYDPHKWAAMAKQAGMKYAVITTKHHDGFCLFDSKYTDYKATRTPYGKDLIKEWVTAFRAQGLKIGFYYSLIDWHHPEYTVDKYHPQSPSNVKAYKKLNKKRDMAKYRTYLYNQVAEILTNYGKVDILWLDFSFPGKHGKDHKDWGSKKLFRLVKKLQPGIIINDRLDLKQYQDGWDFTTPEQFKVSKWPEVDGKKIPWETCQTFSGSWGYYRDEYTWKSTRQLLILLIESVSKGGNVLLNVGPTARGTFDKRAAEKLKDMGAWMKYCGRSIYGCTQAPKTFKIPENTLLTYNPEKKRLYIHLLAYPLNQLKLEGFAGKIKYAQFLHDASEIKISKSRSGYHVKEEVREEDVILNVPVAKPGVEIPVVELLLK